jgi:hypothetical protein
MVRLFIVIAAFGLAACAGNPRLVKRMEVPHGADIGVVAFRDCIIADQEDCDGSGNVAGSVFARVFSAEGFHAVPLSRPVGPKEPLSDDAAVEVAKAKHLPFVINGEVDEFYSVAPMTFRVDRAGVSLRILRVDTGEVAAFFTRRQEAGSNFGTPDGLIEDMAEEVRGGL